jgi:leucyl aminopeptidase
MKIGFAPAALPESGTLVVLATADGGLGASAAELDRRADGALSRAIKLAGDRFKRGQAIELLYPRGLGLDRLVLLSAGQPADALRFDLEALGGSLATKLAGWNVAEAKVAVDALPGLAVAPGELAVLLAGGASLRGYRFEKYRTSREADEEETRDGLKELTFLLAEPGSAEAAWPAAAAMVEGVRHARDLVTEPANVLTPKAFAEECRKLGAETGLDVQILEPAALRELGMNTLLAVGQGSVNEPYVAVMRWAGGPPEDPPLALVGKGVCFDSGGLSLKPADSMQDMKWDMGGAAAVFGAMKTIALRKAKANVVGVLGLVENMPSGTAQRPGDVVTSMSGLTIEVLNTDAEGRLVLADVLHYARDRFKPKAMIDLATLTGAIIVALGQEQAGLFTPDEGLAEKIGAAAKASGDRVWRMPLGPEYAKHVKSAIADVKNIGRAREAGATAGAVFLQKFVGDTPWAHLDIAGTTWSKEDKPLAPKGATGFGTRLLDRLIADAYES